ncbi:hypothetical protein KPL74_15070 [Bacillus sp. NP157]|nr:hypothetical protein KPL74_15070 [Bacillus sp. NP157]
MAYWFLRELGLDASADERGVKRAYALRLKASDPAADPDGFARLRSAFEAARSWAERKAEHEAASVQGTEDVHDEQDIAATVDAIHAEVPAVDVNEHAVRASRVEGNDIAVDRVDATGDEAPAAAPPMARGPSAGQVAYDTLRRFAQAVDTQRDTAVADLLTATTAELRQQHVDALAVFEAMLIDAIAEQQLARRPHLVNAAAEQFAWGDADVHGRGTERDAWIDRVLASRANWLRFPEKRRKQLLGLCEAATKESPAFTSKHVEAWPRIAAVQPYVGEFLRLHVADAVLHAWKEAFNALPAKQRGIARRSAWDPTEPSVPKWRRALGYVGGRWWWWFIGGKILLLIAHALRGSP